MKITINTTRIGAFNFLVRVFSDDGELKYTETATLGSVIKARNKQIDYWCSRPEVKIVEANAVPFPAVYRSRGEPDGRKGFNLKTCSQRRRDSREATEFATLTAKHGVGIVMEAPRLTYGTFGPQSGLSKQIWKLTGDKCSPAQYMLEFSEPWAARRKAIEIMRNIDRIIQTYKGESNG